MEVPILGLRGRAPKSVWAPLVKEARAPSHLDEAVTAVLHQIRQLRDIALDLESIVIVAG